MIDTLPTSRFLLFHRTANSDSPSCLGPTLYQISTAVYRSSTQHVAGVNGFTVIGDLTAHTLLYEGNWMTWRPQVERLLRMHGLDDPEPQVEPQHKHYFHRLPRMVNLLNGDEMAISIILSTTSPALINRLPRPFFCAGFLMDDLSRWANPFPLLHLPGGIRNLIYAFSVEEEQNITFDIFSKKPFRLAAITQDLEKSVSGEPTHLVFQLGVSQRQGLKVAGRQRDLFLWRAERRRAGRRRFVLGV